MISRDGAGISLTTGGQLIGQDGSGIVGQGGGNIVAQGGLNLIGQDGSGIVGQGGGNLLPSARSLLSLNSVEHSSPNSSDAFSAFSLLAKNFVHLFDAAAGVLDIDAFETLNATSKEPVVQAGLKQAEIALKLLGYNSKTQFLASPTAKPFDLTIPTAALDHTKSGMAYHPGDTVKLSWDIENLGHTASDPTTTLIYLSRDKSASTPQDDIEIGSVAESSVLYGNPHKHNFDFHLSSKLRSDTYYVHVVANAVEPRNSKVEVNTNNKSKPLELTVKSASAGRDATVQTVNTGADDHSANNLTSLREALALAAKSPGADTIVFAKGVSTIELTRKGGPLVIARGQNVTIEGDRNGDGVADVTIDGNDRTSHFVVQAGARATLDGLVLTHGHATGQNGTTGGIGAAGRDGIAATGTTDDMYDPLYQAGTGGGGGAGTAGGSAVGSVENHGALTVSHGVLSFNSATGGTGGAGGAGGRGGNGTDGPNGKSGKFGETGAAGSDGGIGGIGGTGGVGGNGIAAILNAKGGKLTLTDVALLSNHGFGGVGGVSGKGGRGGDGGDGGDGGIGVPYTDDQHVFHGHDEVDGEANAGGTGQFGGSGGSSGVGGDGFGAILSAGKLSGSVAFVGNTVAAGHGGATGGGGAGGGGR